METTYLGAIKNIATEPNLNMLFEIKSLRKIIAHPLYERTIRYMQKMGNMFIFLLNCPIDRLYVLFCFYPL